MEEINSQTLKAVSEEKDLGIIFHDDLKFTKHIYTKDQKAKSMLGLITRTFNYLDKNSYIRFYKSMVRSQLATVCGIHIYVKTLKVLKLFRKGLQDSYQD